MGGQGFFGLEWMPNTHTPILNQSKKKDKHNYKTYFKIKKLQKINLFLVCPIWHCKIIGV
jgi:hypothetical protein